MITGSGERVAESFDGDQNAAPLLRVTFTVDGAATTTTAAPSTTTTVSSTTTTTTTPPAQATLDIRVAASNDDAEEKLSSGSVTTGSSDLELVYDKEDQIVGMRFNDVTIPQGSAIVAAHVQFQADETASEETSLTIRGEDVDDALIFERTTGNISSRTTTTAFGLWSPAEWASKNEADTDQQTEDIASVIQEIVSRDGWSSGNSLALIITGSGKRTAESFDGDAAGAPLLHVQYVAGP
jgi:hypothetical protein